MFLTALLSGGGALNAADDWAQIGRYAEANKKIIENNNPEKCKVVFMGNSITDEWARLHPSFFTENGFVGRGISGQTTYQFLLRFRDDVINLHPEAVIINGGTNDIAENNYAYDEDRTFGNIVSMAEMANANGIKVILSTLPPAANIYWKPTIKNVPEKIRRMNERLKNYAEEKGYGFIDYFTPLAAPDGSLKKELTKDGIHPLPSGYDVMEVAALEIINPILSKE